MVLVAGQIFNLADPVLNADPLFAVTGMPLSFSYKARLTLNASQTLLLRSVSSCFRLIQSWSGWLLMP